MNKPKLLDTVALTVAMPERRLARGQVGTVVAELDYDVYEVEFCDEDGRTYASLPVESTKLMVLHYRPSEVR